MLQGWGTRQGSRHDRRFHHFRPTPTRASPHFRNHLLPLLPWGGPGIAAGRRHASDSAQAPTRNPLLFRRASGGRRIAGAALVAAGSACRPPFHRTLSGSGAGLEAGKSVTRAAAGTSQRDQRGRGSAFRPGHQLRCRQRQRRPEHHTRLPRVRAEPRRTRPLSAAGL